MSTGLIDGTRVGEKYVLNRLLGRGGNGEVWLAYNEVTRGTVAIKIVTASDAERLARGVQEAYVGANLNHRNVVRVYDAFYGTQGRTFFLVMEALRGETLAQRLTRHALTVAEALAVAAGVLRGLGHAHEQGVLHRDLSPSNIILASEEGGRAVPKLVDFGLAKVRDSSIRTEASTVLGTPQYMSPEQVRATELDGRSDLFSVGILLYEMITHECPFDRATSSASLAAILEDTVDPHPAVPPKLWLVIERALSKYPVERFANAQEFLSALEAAASGPIEGTVPEELVDLAPRKLSEPVIAPDASPPAVAAVAHEIADEEPPQREAGGSAWSRARKRRKVAQKWSIGVLTAALCMVAAAVGVSALRRQGIATASATTTQRLTAVEPAAAVTSAALVASTAPVARPSTSAIEQPALPAPTASASTPVPRVASPTPPPPTFVATSAARPRPRPAVATTPGF